MEFSDRLCEVRRERGLTQVELAARVGIHPSQLHRYEAGAAQPSFDVLRRLCIALSVSADSLLFRDDSHQLVEGRIRTALENAVYLSEHEQAVVAELVEAFVHAHVAKTRPYTSPHGPTPRRKRKES